MWPNDPYEQCKLALILLNTYHHGEGWADLDLIGFVAVFLPEELDCTWEETLELLSHVEDCMRLDHEHGDIEDDVFALLLDDLERARNPERTEDGLIFENYGTPMRRLNPRSG